MKLHMLNQCSLSFCSYNRRLAADLKCSKNLYAFITYTIFNAGQKYLSIKSNRLSLCSTFIEPVDDYHSLLLLWFEYTKAIPAEADQGNTDYRRGWGIVFIHTILQKKTRRNSIFVLIRFIINISTSSNENSSVTPNSIKVAKSTVQYIKNNVSRTNQSYFPFRFIIIVIPIPIPHLLLYTH